MCSPSADAGGARRRRRREAHGAFFERRRLVEFVRLDLALGDDDVLVVEVVDVDEDLLVHLDGPTVEPDLEDAGPRRLLVGQAVRARRPHALGEELLTVDPVLVAGGEPLRRRRGLEGWVVLVAEDREDVAGVETELAALFDVTGPELVDRGREAPERLRGELADAAAGLEEAGSQSAASLEVVR